ncbi:MAG: hypothetical protein B7Z80_00915 [Rhodospirillales bacterium 20-64-7]|nr:MAG: hypothetical protein B7Z80_00915 [Rhodospirillales bacterium 20-64-7]
MSDALGLFQRADQEYQDTVFMIAYFTAIEEEDADFDLICKYFDNIINGSDESWEALEPILDYVRPVPISVAAPVALSENPGPKRLVISEDGVEDRTEEPLTEEEMMMLTK